MKAWCDNQIKCAEDADDTFTCIEHIGDGRAFECPYKTPEDAMKAEYKCWYEREREAHYD